MTVHQRDHSRRGQMVALFWNGRDSSAMLFFSYIDQLSVLDYLDLRGNQFSVLPPAIEQLPALRMLLLDHNPLPTPPPEVTVQGLQAIRDYLRTHTLMGCHTDDA